MHTLKWLEEVACQDPMAARVAALVDRWILEPSLPTIGIGIQKETGRTIGLYGPCVPTWPPDALVAAMQHELTHLACGHQVRCPAEGYPLIWNLAADAVVHYVGQIDLKAIGKIGPPVTFESLDLPVAPVEPTYEALIQKIEQQGCGCGDGQGDANDGQDGPPCPVHGKSCGRDEALKRHGLGGSEKLKMKAQAALAAKGVKGPSGAAGRSLIPDLPPPPAWAREVQRYFLAQRRRYPVRAWRRGPSHRLEEETIPGRPRIPKNLSATIMLDASGSMTDQQVREAIGAVRSAGWQDVKIRVFSDWLGPPIQPRQVAEEVAKHGGGTLILKAAQEIDAEQHVVWLTDAESADGLPATRDGWVWVVSRGSTWQVMTHPQAL